MSDAHLDRLQAAAVLTPLDVAFARTAARLAAETRPPVILAAALASRAVGRGHVCVELDAVLASMGEWPEDVPAPAPSWREVLADSPLVATSEAAATRFTPLVLDPAGRVYLRRYWEHQRTVVAGIRRRLGGGEIDADLTAEVGRFFPEAPPAGPDWQRIAAATAVARRFCVISGGPGTGKTYTVAVLLAILAARAHRVGTPPPRVALLAPTGKAAARLREAIAAAKRVLPLAPPERDAIPDEAATIHRALGAVPGSATRFRHGPERPLTADVVVVDEASMVDLALLSRLVAALHDGARLVLVGDKDQLASVEAGAVLGDICNTGGVVRYSPAFARDAARVGGASVPAGDARVSAGDIGDSVVHLVHSRRYTAGSGIGRLAAAVVAGRADDAVALLTDGAYADVALCEDPAGAVARAVEAATPLLGDADPTAQLRQLERFRILCALRRGPRGVEALNVAVEEALEQAGLIDRSRGAYYPGRPVMVLRNDYQLGLFNGDVGCVIAADAAPRRVAFPGPADEVRAIPVSRLPEHETVLAMSVHKSQGSEFDEVAVILPDDPNSPILTRELLYTAVTRARHRVVVYAPPEIVAAAVARPVRRTSGLREALWSA